MDNVQSNEVRSNLVSRRYETGAMLITRNRSVAEWGTVFANPVVATAILDRLLHHSHVTIRGDSYPLRAKRNSGLIRPPVGDRPPVGSTSLRPITDRAPHKRGGKGHEGQNEGNEAEEKCLRHARYPKSHAGQPLREGSADQALDNTRYRFTYHRKQMSGAIASYARGTDAHIGSHLGAVPIKEEAINALSASFSRPTPRTAPLATAISFAGPISFVSSMRKAGALYAISCQ